MMELAIAHTAIGMHMTVRIGIDFLSIPGPTSSASEFVGYSLACEDQWGKFHKLHLSVFM